MLSNRQVFLLVCIVFFPCRSHRCPQVHVAKQSELNNIYSNRKIQSEKSQEEQSCRES